MPASRRFSSIQTTLSGLGIVAASVVVPAANEPETVTGKSSAKALALLQGDLAKTVIPATADKIPRREVEGLIQVRPLILPPIKLATGVQVLRRIASRDELRPALCGVYLDVPQKVMVATNGHALVVLTDASLTGKSRVISLENGSIIPDRYPEYENVIPIKRTLLADVPNLNELRGKLAGVLRASKFVKFPSGVNIRAEISYGGHYYYFDPELFLHVVEALLQSGTKAIRLEFDESPKRALLLRDVADKNKLAILMPVMNTDAYGDISSYRAEQIPFCPVLDFMENPAHDDFSDVNWNKVKPKGTGAALKAIVATAKNSTKTADIKPEKSAKAKAIKSAKKTSKLSYFNEQGKLVQDETGEVDSENLYYVQPDGSYEKGGDRRSPGWLMPPTKKSGKAKTARAKKAKPADTRAEVAHFDADLTFFRQFVALTEKPVTITQVRNLHRKLEQAITSRKVRKASAHAPLLKLVAEKVATAFEKMTDEKIATVDKLSFPADVVSQARTLATGSKVSGAVTLLTRFINMQGQSPERKAVDALLKSLEKEHADHGSSPYALAVGAAVATLRDWQPGKAVGISTQQLGRLSGLSGLGCACQEAAAAKAVPLASAPTAKRATARPALGNVGSIFTPIGEKDHRAAVGKLLHLPGDLGRFLGDIEDHEYALAIRGEKGAGKTRLLYQLMDLFASTGLNGGLFSLEIAKNSDVVRRNTEAYIKPANRGRVLIASEAQSLDTIRQAARTFKVVAVDSWGKIPGVTAADFDLIRKEFPNTIFLVIFQSTTAGTSRGGSSSEYDASAVCQVNLPGVAVMEKNRYATGAADELRYLVNEQRLAQPGE